MNINNINNLIFRSIGFVSHLEHFGSQMTRPQTFMSCLPGPTELSAPWVASQSCCQTLNCLNAVEVQAIKYANVNLYESPAFACVYCVSSNTVGPSGVTGGPCLRDYRVNSLNRLRQVALSRLER